MPFATLLVTDNNNIRWITVNRPDKLNALNSEVITELGRALTDFVADPHASALVVTGSGEKAFVAGADISEFVDLDAAQARELSRRGQRLFNAIETSPKPIVAAVNGFALGGGCELAMACHLRVASTNARFGQPEVKLGLIPGYGGTQRLPRLVGRGRALELLLTGRMIDAATARSWGLVNHVVEPGELTGAVQKLIEEILAVSPLAAARCLEAVRIGLDQPLDQALAAEAELFSMCAGTQDMKEGTAAFLQRRPPRFAGK